MLSISTRIFMETTLMTIFYRENQFSQIYLYQILSLQSHLQPISSQHSQNSWMSSSKCLIDIQILIWRVNYSISLQLLRQLGGYFHFSITKDPTEDMCGALTFSVPGSHGNKPVDLGLTHGTDHGVHGPGVARHRWEEGRLEAEAGHDHILFFKMSLQTVFWEYVSFHHLEGADRETWMLMNCEFELLFLIRSRASSGI